MILLGYIIALLNGRLDAVNKEFLNSAADAVKLCINLTGAVCLWSGLMEIAKEGGVMKFIAKIFSPILSVLFRGIPGDHPARGTIIMNLTANLLGLGNAATPVATYKWLFRESSVI